MKSLSKIRRSRTGTWLIAPVCLLSIVSALAQRDRISHVLDNYRTVVVPGHLIPLAKAEFDHGAVPGDFALRGMTLTVRRSAAQQKDLNQLLTAQQNPASPSYHKWLTPEAFAKRFGASSNDLETLRQWLESQGFQIKAVAHNGTFIRFDATASQVQNAFKTEIHQYTVNGAKHYANASEPSLPANLAPLVLAVGGMNDFAPHPNSAKLPTRNAKVKAHYYDSSDNTDLAPGDLAAIYDLVPLQTAEGVSYGSGQTVVVIGQSDVTAGDLTAYCAAMGLNSFGCAENFSQTFVGSDPGATGDALQSEATADVELVKAVAPGATLLLETDGDAGGVWAAFSDAVDNARGQVILMRLRAMREHGWLWADPRHRNHGAGSQCARHYSDRCVRRLGRGGLRCHRGYRRDGRTCRKCAGRHSRSDGCGRHRVYRPI
jgi:GNAT superfamily N-acetyltransferase